MATLNPRDYKWKEAQFYCPKKKKKKASLGRFMSSPMDIPTKEHQAINNAMLAKIDGHLDWLSAPNSATTHPILGHHPRLVLLCFVFISQAAQ